MRRWGLVVAVCCLATVVSAGEWIDFGAGDGAQEATVSGVQVSAGEVQFEVELPGMMVTAVETSEGAFTRIEIPGLGQTGKAGAPLLPALRKLVDVPFGASATVRFEVLERRSISLGERGLPARLYPVQLPVPKCDCDEARAWRFSYDAAAYEQASTQSALIDGSGRMRDHELVRVELDPVGYEPATGRLEVASRLRATVELAGGDLGATLAARARLASRRFDAILANHTVNLARIPGYGEWQYPNDAPIEMVIVTPTNLAADLTPFVEWKTSCGYHVTVATTDVAGTTTTAIKSYLTALYNGATPPVYVLMIGDSPTPLPTYTNSNAPGGTDLLYVQMDGDLYPDMIAARWPVDDSGQLVAVRDKVLTYEQAEPGSSAWLDRALFLAGGSYEGTVTTHEDVIQYLMGPTTSNGAQTDLWYDSSNPTTSQLINDLNSGRGWAVYSAHGSTSGWVGAPSFQSGDVAGMGNAGMYPLGFGHACQTNQWADTSNVFGEVVTTAANKGFVSYWGGSNYTYWDEDDWAEKGFFDALVEDDLASNAGDWDGQYSQGAACYSGLTEVSLQGSLREQYYWEMYNLDGDPSLDPFTRLPSLLNVGAPAVVPPAAVDDFQVVVTDPGRGAVAGALVGVSQAGVLLGAGFSDVTGTASFHVDAPSEGAPLLVRVTAHNHYPTDAETMVAAGSEGVVALDGALYRCDSLVGIDVFDENAAAPLTVRLDNGAGDWFDVAMTLVDPGIGHWTGGAGLGADLVVSDGALLTATYQDADTGSGGSAVVTDTALLDCAGPIISNVVATAAEGRIVITFTIDESGTGSVRYGTTPALGSVVDDAAMATSHELEIAGVDPCTRYYFEVDSVDALGNLGTADDNGAPFTVDSAGWGVFFDDDLATDPGWTVDNGSHASTGWAFGQPTGQGQDGYGGPDPTAGHTGTVVYGVNLDGDVSPYLGDDELKLTTPAIDLTDALSARLRFWRWLGVERDSYDHARIQYSVDGGSTWTTVWQNAGDTIDDTSWSEIEVELPAAVLGQPDVRLRWTYGATDGSWNYCGWNIDDVVVEGAAVCTVNPMPFSDGFESGDCGGWSEEYPAP